MNKIPATVLITTANNPPNGIPYLAMTNSSMRKIAAKGALYFWVASGVKKIVLADATGMNLLTAAEIAEIETIGVQIEQISYMQDTAQVIKKGKGYGEGKLIEHAIQKSKLLANEDYFFKITGKTYVRNFTDLYQAIKNNKITTLFWRHMGDGTSMQAWVDCRFYYTSKEFALNMLIPAYLEADDSVAACEYYVYLTAKQNLMNGKAPRPLVTGYAGQTGEAYFDLSLGALDYNFPCWLSVSAS